MNNIIILERIRGIISSGRFIAFLKAALFLNFAFFAGIWLGFKIFFPDDFILSRINRELFVKDMGLLAEDVSISPFGSISFIDGTIQEKGENVITFHKFKFSPSIFDLIKGRISGEIIIEDINNQGGELEVSFESGEKPCYSFVTDEMPLSIFKPFMNDVSFSGNITGEGNFCKDENKKYSGNSDIKGSDVLLRGKIPTPMGQFDVGKIILGEIDLSFKVADNKAEIERFVLNGLMVLDIAGKIVLNSKMFVSSRLDLDVRVDVPDMSKISENPALNLLVGQMSQYKTEKENGYAFMLRGFLTKPQMTRAPKERIIKGENQSASAAKSKRNERNKSKRQEKTKEEVPSEEEVSTRPDFKRPESATMPNRPLRERFQAEEAKEEAREEMVPVEEPKQAEQAVEEVRHEAEKLPVQEEEVEQVSPPVVEKKENDNENNNDGE